MDSEQHRLNAHSHGWSPVIATDSRDTVTEALCEGCKFPQVVILQQVQKGGREMGTRPRYPAGIACTRGYDMSRRVWSGGRKKAVFNFQGKNCGDFIIGVFKSVNSGVRGVVDFSGCFNFYWVPLRFTFTLRV